MKGSYSNDDALFNLVKYILNVDKMPNGLIGGQGVPLPYGADVYMNDVRCIFNHDGRQAEHYVLSFTQEEFKRIDTRNAMELGYAICDFFKGVQVLFAYHECKDNSNALDTNHYLHIHFAIGTTNYITGKKYYTDRYEALRLRAYTESILNEKNISNDYLCLQFG